MIITNWLAEIFVKGGLVFMLPLTAMSVAGLAVLIDRTVAFRKKNIVSPMLESTLAKMNSNSPEDTQLGNCMTGSIIKNARAHQKESGGTLEEAIATQAEYQLSFLSRRIWMFSALGNLAPLTGLLGTVVGLVKAFAQISESGMSPQSVSAGISIALITTVTGLTIAIPNLLAYYGFRAWGERNYHLVKHTLEVFLNKTGKS